MLANLSHEGMCKLIMIDVIVPGLCFHHVKVELLQVAMPHNPKTRVVSLLEKKIIFYMMLGKRRARLTSEPFLIYLLKILNPIAWRVASSNSMVKSQVFQLDFL